MIHTSVHLDFIFSIASFTIGYIILHFWGNAEAIDNRDFQSFRSGKNSFRSVVSQKWLGFLLLGLVPAIILFIFGTHTREFYGTGSIGEGNLWAITLGLAILVILVNYFNCRREDNLAQYPQIRISQWSVRILLISGLSWIAYICGYEFVLRGLILQTSIEVLNPDSAIILNLSFYALIHIPKGIKETLASVPFGLILCLLVMQSGSLWPAVFLHAVLALSNEWMSLYFHPEISLKWK